MRFLNVQTLDFYRMHTMLSTRHSKAISPLVLEYECCKANINKTLDYRCKLLFHCLQNVKHSIVTSYCYDLPRKICFKKNSNNFPHNLKTIISFLQLA